MSQGYPNLEQMLGGYFHQDWRAEFKDVAAAAKAFVQGNAEQVKPASEELKRLAAAHHGAALGAELEKLGCAAHGKAPDSFVAEVQKVLSEAH
jgi:hypothetical protein